MKITTVEFQQHTDVAIEKHKENIVGYHAIDYPAEAYTKIVQGNRVKVILPCGTSGVAICSDNDVFDEEKGYQIAWRKATITRLKKDLRAMWNG